jgi:uncharacterized protein (DUF488 family)
MAKPPIELYTLGYQGIDLSTYIDILSTSGVGVVIDVRERAWSYKRDFVKSAFRNGLAEAGIEYVHLRSAGNPRENRTSAKSVAECLDRYREHLQENDGCLSELLDCIRTAYSEGKRACLTCFERHPDECHRSILLESLAAREPLLKPVHLPTGVAD